MSEREKNDSKKALFALHVLFAVYALSSVMSKLASGEEVISVRFVLYYLIMIALLGVYAIFYQQIIKHLSLTTAYANRAAVVIWGVIYGVLFFHETITVQKLAGIALIIAGIVIYATDGREDAL